MAPWWTRCKYGNWTEKLKLPRRSVSLRTTPTLSASPSRTIAATHNYFTWRTTWARHSGHSSSCTSLVSWSSSSCTWFRPSTRSHTSTTFSLSYRYPYTSLPSSRLTMRYSNKRRSLQLSIALIWHSLSEEPGSTLKFAASASISQLWCMASLARSNLVEAASAATIAWRLC